MRNDEKLKVIITGATGYLGGSFVNYLYKKYDLFCVVRSSSNTDNIKEKCTIIKYDQVEELYDEFKRISPDIMVHFAGVFLNNHNSDNIKEMLECNIVFSTIVVDAAVQAGCKKIINTSSYWQNFNIEVYNPVNLYAATKQGFEDILKYYVEAEECKVITLTIFDTYGPNDRRRKILNIINDLHDGDEIEMSSGKQKMYFCYVDDVIDAYDVAIGRCMEDDCSSYEKYSLRDETPVSLRYVAEKMTELSNKKVNFKWGGIPNRKREISDPCDLGVILPGWTPKFSIEKGISNMIKSNLC